MSEYYSIRFQGKLNSDIVRTADDFAELAERLRLNLQPDTPASTSYGLRPSFGPEIAFKGTDFSRFRLVSVEDGNLRLGVFAVDVFRQDYAEDELGNLVQYDRTFCDAILQALTTLTTGDPGEIQGVIGWEESDTFDGWPIVRCADGKLRMLKTPLCEFPDDGWGVTTPSLELEALPVQFAKGSKAKHLQLDIEMAKLTEYLRSAEMDISRSPDF